MAIPYMGTKRKLAPKIVNFIKERHPKIKHFYDLFGGGAAISLEAVNHFDTVYYNEIDKGVKLLLDQFLKGDIEQEPDFYKWISREEFHERKYEDSWQGGLIKTCWSFGNNGTRYLYGEAVEDKKRQLHDLIVHTVPTDIFKPSEDALSADRVQARRLAIMREFKAINDKFQLEHLERLQHLEKINKANNLFTSNFSALNFSKFNDDSVIYLDPPYFGTETYQNEFYQDSFKAWVLSLDVPVYISSYECDWLECIAEFDHRSTLSSTNNSKRVKERLFWNGVE